MRSRRSQSGSRQIGITQFNKSVKIVTKQTAAHATAPGCLKTRRILGRGFRRRSAIKAALNGSNPGVPIATTLAT
jgi:hypothetical protein